MLKFRTHLQWCGYIGNRRTIILILKLNLKLNCIIIMAAIVLFTFQIPGSADNNNHDLLKNELQQVLDSQVKKLGVPGIQAS